jgi:hypothetical protein
MKNIFERLTYDQLYRMSEPKRKVRALTVKGPPLKIETSQDANYWAFNFKANPSTTGLRHHGYIKYIRPPSPRPLSNVECVLDCDCHDFKFRYAWAVKQRQSSTVGPQSMNQAHNRAPRITNPEGRPGLCKHLLALKDYIYGAMSSFPGTGRDSGKLLSKLIKYANNKWINMPGEIEQARARDQQAAAVRAARNRGMMAPTEVPAPTQDEIEDEGTPPPPPSTVTAQDTPEVPELGPDLRGGQIPFVGTNRPPTEIGKGPKPPKKKSGPEEQKGKKSRGGKKEESVVIKNRMNIKQELTESISLLNELEDSATMDTDFSIGGDDSGGLESSDLGSEIDAAPEDEASEALQCLRDMRDALLRLSPSEEEQEELDAPLPEPTVPGGEEGGTEKADGLGDLNSNDEVEDEDNKFKG